MEKFLKLLKEHKLAESLMQDQEFIDGAKKALKQDNIEVNDKQLNDLMKKIEDKLQNSEELKDSELENVSAGGDAALAVKMVTTATCGALGGIIGVFGGVDIGSRSGNKAAGPRDATDHYTIEQSTTILHHTLAGIAICGAGNAAVFGYAGYKLGEWICKKTGLE